MIIDATVWVSAFVASDPNHRMSRRWLDQQVAANALLVSPVMVLSEVAGVISRHAGEPQLAHRAVSTLLRFPRLRLLSMDGRLGRQAADVAADLGLTGAEAVYVAAAKALWVPLITWDLDLQHRADKLVPIHEPSGAIPATPPKPGD